MKNYQKIMCGLLVIFLGALMTANSQASNLKLENNAYLLFGHQNNVWHNTIEKSDNKLEFGINSILNYKDTDIFFNLNLKGQRENFDKTSDYSIISIKPQFEYYTQTDIIFSSELFYNRGYEDYEEGISNAR
ncbi:MAG TPA: hypothetical protein PLJ38_10950, partial [bacterium]|nr:hypothetical protein [bacterium]